MTPVVRLHNPIIGQIKFSCGDRCRFSLSMTTSQPLSASESLAATGEVKQLNRVRNIRRMYKVELYTIFSDVRSSLVPKMV